MNKIIDGKKIQSELKEELKQEIKDNNLSLNLTVIQVGDDPASSVYVKNKQKLCEYVGIDFTHLKFDNITEDNLLNEIDRLNNDHKVTGILVQLPLPKEIDEKRIIEKINPLKDVDGLTINNLGKLFNNKSGLVPCTALGILKMLEKENISVEGKNITIVGRSSLVGLPLTGLFLNQNATVTTCHSKTKDLKEHTKKADILVVAIGQKEFITKDYVKEDAIVIDVGINRYENKLYGDCNFNDIYDKCQLITPVPGGVGPLTVVMLGFNVLQAYVLQNK